MPQTFSPIPHLRPQGSAQQLIVDGQPFLMLAGEIHNSTSSSLAYMEPIWDRLAAMNLNTVIAPLYWELIEPQEGTYDFGLLDGLVEGARKRDLRLVLLWFASWKNATSSYVPGWVKTEMTNESGNIDAAGAAAGLLARLEALTLETSGTFWHANGEPLPW